MNIIAWIVLIVNGLSCCLKFKDIFTDENTKDRVLSGIGFLVHGMTVYLMLYMLGILV